MKIIFLLDQIQAGLGGKEHGDQPLGGQKRRSDQSKCLRNC